MSYNINPCKACWQKYKNGDCDINDVNNCIVDTSTAFNEFPSNNTMRGNPQGQNWQDCISKKLAELPYVAGKPRSFCNYQLNVAPRWVQEPHYYPRCLEETKDPKKALQKCYNLCKGSKLRETCKITCNTDHNAVENFSPIAQKSDVLPCNLNKFTSAGIPGIKESCTSRTQKPRKESFTFRKQKSRPTSTKESYKAKTTFQGEASANPLAFWGVFIPVALLLSIILLIFGITLFTKKFGAQN